MDSKVYKILKVCEIWNWEIVECLITFLTGWYSFYKELSCPVSKGSGIVTIYKSFREAEMSQGFSWQVNSILVQYKGQHTSRLLHWAGDMKEPVNQNGYFPQYSFSASNQCCSFWFLSLIFQTSEVCLLDLLCLLVFFHLASGKYRLQFFISLP